MKFSCSIGDMSPSIERHASIWMSVQCIVYMYESTFEASLTSARFAIEQARNIFARTTYIVKNDDRCHELLTHHLGDGHEMHFAAKRMHTQNLKMNTKFRSIASRTNNVYQTHFSAFIFFQIFLIFVKDGEKNIRPFETGQSALYSRLNYLLIKQIKIIKN